MSSQPRRIKKYKNRRLYDMDSSQYITVETLQRYVTDGVSFHVEEATTGHDITNATLLQIFIDMEAGPTQFLSSEMLRQLIILAQHPMQQTFKTMLSQTMTRLESNLNQNPFLSEGAFAEQAQLAMKQWYDLLKPK